MAATKAVELDVRPIPVREKHPTIFRTFDGLAAGEAILLINDHDPKPLHYQFEAEYKGQYEWAYDQQGPKDWIARIKKV